MCLKKLNGLDLKVILIEKSFPMMLIDKIRKIFIKKSEKSNTLAVFMKGEAIFTYDCLPEVKKQVFHISNV
jgi:hypothetical protein